MNKQYQYRFTHYVFNPRSNELYNGKETHTLEQKVTDLLLVFCQHPGEILGKDKLLKKVWPGRIVNEESLSVAISKLRRILSDSRYNPSYIKTITGKGYLWLPEVVEEVSGDAEKNIQTPQEESQAIDEPGFGSSRMKYALGLTTLVISLLSFWAPIELWDGDSTSSDTQLSEEILELAKQAEQHNQDADLEKRREAIKLYRQILAEHPDYLPAYTGIARAKFDLSARESFLDIELYAEEIMALTNHVLERDPKNAEAWTVLGHLYFIWEWDFERADDAYRKGIQYAPEEPLSYLPYTEFLLARGEFQQAEDLINQLRSLNPAYYRFVNMSFVYLMRNEPEKALAEINRLEKTEDQIYRYNSMLHRLGILLGDPELAFSQLLILFNKHQLPEQQIQEYQQEFLNNGLEGLFSKFLEQRLEFSLGHHRPPLAWARYAIVAQQPDKAIYWLQQAFEQRQIAVLFIGVDPHYQPLRNHPEFKELLKQLPQSN